MNLIANEYLIAAAAGLAAFWRTVRVWLDLLLSVVWVRAEVMHPASSILLRHLEERYHTNSMGAAVYSSWREYVRPRRRIEQVPVELTPVRRLYWRGLALLSVAARVDNKESREPGLSVTVGHVRGAFNLEQLLIAAHREHNAQHSPDVPAHDRFRVKYHGGHRERDSVGGAVPQPSSPSDRFEGNGPTAMLRPLGLRLEDLGAETSGTPFAGLVYPPAVEQAAERIRRWHRSQDFYRGRRIPWRMGALLHGAAGTGKTSFARAIAQELRIPVHVLDLAGMDNEGLHDAWLSSVYDSPCVVLIEDLDRVFTGAENRLQNSRLTLDALLNCVSGVLPSEGVLTLVTCNDPQKLDPALGVPGGNGVSTRPGRLDLSIEFGPMERPGKFDLAAMILGGGELEPGEEDAALYAKIASDPHLATPAQVQARCAEIALERLYGDSRL